MADEIDAGQERGEISTGGRPDEPVQTADRLGLNWRRVAEWRATKGEGGVEKAIQSVASPSIDITDREAYQEYARLVPGR
jgi:hypothetical protein